MKFEQIVSVTQNALAQSMGAEYMEKVGDLAAIDSNKLADIGRDVADGGSVEGFTHSLISLLGKLVLDTRTYKTRMKSLMIDSFDWGGFIERTRFGLSDIMDSPMYNLVRGRDYSAIEHTFYGIDAKTKIYEEGKAIMTPISVQRELLRDAFRSWDALDRYLSAYKKRIETTLNLALDSYTKMLVGCGVAISDLSTKTAKHVITDAVAAGIVSKVSDGEGGQRNPTYAEIMTSAEKKAFLSYFAKTIKITKQHFDEFTTAFNDKTVPTFSDGDVNVIVLSDVLEDFKFDLKADTFHDDEVGFGAVDTIGAWQAVTSDADAATPKYFDFETISTINISADATNKLGIGTQGYEKSNIACFMYDRMALGVSVMRNKVTSSYTACADFWNEFHHMLLNYIIDTSYSMVAFILD